MWDVVGIIAAVVVIVLMLQLLDVAEVLKDRLRGRISRDDLEEKVQDLERRVAELEKR